MQRALLLRNRQLIARLREVVHTDIEVTRFDKLHQPRAKNRKLLHPFRQMCSERALLFLQPWHVGITEQRNPVGLQLQNLVHRVAEALWRLIRQAINQIHVDAVKLQFPCCHQQIACQFERLNPMDGGLHFRVKVLNPHAQAVESQFAQRFQVRPGSHAGIDLDPDFRVGRKLKMLSGEFKQIRNLFGS